MSSTAWRTSARLLVVSSAASLSLIATTGTVAHAADRNPSPADGVTFTFTDVDEVLDPFGVGSERRSPLVVEQRAEHRHDLRRQRARQEARREARREERRLAQQQSEAGVRALEAARTRAGMPYVYGATGPDAFDCSGLTQWAFRQAGIELPRTAAEQAGAVQQVSDPQVGDLVFFSDGGHVYHVGIYAGDGMVWHASRPGVPVGEERIWTSSVFYGRIG